MSEPPQRGFTVVVHLVVAAVLLLLLIPAARLLWYYPWPLPATMTSSAVPAYFATVTPTAAGALSATAAVNATATPAARTQPYTTSVTPINPVPASTGVVLFDAAHENAARLDDVATLVEALQAQGMQVEVVEEGADALSKRLRSAAALIVATPRKRFSAEESALLREFVANNGRLLVISDPVAGLGDILASADAGIADVVPANSVLTSFGLRFADGFLYNVETKEGYFRYIAFDTFAPITFTQALSRVVLYDTRPITTTSGLPLIMGNASTHSSASSAASAPVAVLSADGHVLALGDLTFMAPPYDAVADNRQLIANVATFLAGRPRR